MKVIQEYNLSKVSADVNNQSSKCENERQAGGRAQLGRKWGISERGSVTHLNLPREQQKFFLHVSPNISDWEKFIN